MKIEKEYDVDRLTDELGVNIDVEQSTPSEVDEDYEFHNRTVNFEFENPESEFDDTDFDDEEFDYFSAISILDDESGRPYERWKNDKPGRGRGSKPKLHRRRWHFDDDEDDLW